MRTDEFDFEKTSITFFDEQGEKIECDVLMTFDLEETGKTYIILTDNTVDEDGNIRVYAYCFDPRPDHHALLPVETDREQELIQELVDGLMEKIGE